MGKRITRTLVRVLAAACAVASFCPDALTHSAYAEERCQAASAQAATDTLAARGEAVMCEVNAVRAEHGLRPLRFDSRLQFAAGNHAWDMVNRRYFAHDTPEGIDLVQRAKFAKWIPRRREWRLGEVLAAGCYTASTAAAAVEGWLNSPGHREVILDPRMRLIGWGLMDIDQCTVWVLDLGRKLRR